MQNSYKLARTRRHVVGMSCGSRNISQNSYIHTYIHTYIALYSLTSYQMTHEVHTKIHKRQKQIQNITFYAYRCNSFIADLRHTFAVRNMNEMPVLVLSSELSNKTCTATEVNDERTSPILHLLFALSE